MSPAWIVILDSVLTLIPENDEYVWRCVPDPQEGFEANGTNAREVEGWARLGTDVSTERLARTLRSTQIVWGSIVGSGKGTNSGPVSIQAVDTTWYRIAAEDQVVNSIKRGLGVHDGDG